MSNESEKYQIIQLLNAELNLSRYLAEKIYFDSFRLLRYYEVEDNCEVILRRKPSNTTESKMKEFLYMAEEWGGLLVD